MSNYFIAGPAVVDMFKGSELFGTSNTLINSAINISVSSADIAGGSGNILFGKYFHSSKLELNLEDTMFKLDFIAKSVGSTITIGGDLTETETVVLTAGGNGTVTKATPVAFGSYGVIGWYSIPGTSSWSSIEFTGSNFAIQNGQAGESVCVKYIKNATAARKLIVSGNIIPDTIKLIMKASLFAGDATNLETSTRVGYVQIEIPRFLLDGKQDLSLSATGASTTKFSGSALGNIDSTSCDLEPYYAIITENIEGRTWQDLTKFIAVADSDITIAKSGTSKLEVYAVPYNGSAFKPPIGDLTFATSSSTIATVNTDGVVTAKTTAGTATITVTVASSVLDATAYITVPV